MGSRRAVKLSWRGTATMAGSGSVSRFGAISWARSTIAASLGASKETQVEEKNAATTLFSELLAANAPAPLALRPTPTSGLGLVAEKDIVSAGTIVLSVPIEKCLVVDYASGLQVPPGEWPRLKKGVDKDNSLPWDVLLSLALLDGLAGAGDEFWARYSNEVLPQPLLLTLPLCLPEHLLQKIDHAAVADAARSQKQRLAELFPGLARSLCDDGPTWMEWAFACVRSRAFALGKECFAFVPFVDVANHAQVDPAADFRLSPDKKSVELFSLAALDKDAEISISYTGKEGYTNQRLMQQYGFVPRSGNFADRYPLQCLADSSDSVVSNTKLSLEAIQAALGDGDEMVAAFSGRDTFMFAALKSLPVALTDAEAAPLAQQREAAAIILQEITAERETWQTSLEHDEEELLRLEAAARAGHGDCRLEAVVRYNVQRKLLVNSMQRVLRNLCD